MKRHLHKSLVFLIATAALWTTTACGAKPPKAPTNGELLKQKMQRLIIPKLEFREATFAEAFEFIKKKSIEVDSHPGHIEGRGVIVRLPPKDQMLDAIPAIPAGPGTNVPAEAKASMPLNPGPDPEDPRNTRVTMSGVNLPVYEAVRCLCAAANLKLRMLEDAIEIIPMADPDPLHTRDFRIPATFFARLAKSDEAEDTDEQARAKKNFRDYLTRHGVTFPDGAAAILNDNETRLTVRNSSEQLDRIAAILDGRSDKADGTKPSPAVEAFRKRMNQVILPEVRLENVSLSIAVAQIRELADLQHPPAQRGGTFPTAILSNPHSASNDQSIPDSPTPPPALPGLSATSQQPPETPTPANKPAGGPMDDSGEIPISYTARNVPLLPALEAVARLAHYEMAVDEYAVVFKKAVWGATSPAKEATPVGATNSTIPAETNKP